LSVALGPAGDQTFGNRILVTPDSEIQRRASDADLSI